ncbi:MAG: hypothetical protein L0G86_03445 [Pseudomonas sp.]|nr:hypothetical protein [Pseudomonas sp.]
MIKDANSFAGNFEGGLAAIYRAILDKISPMDLGALDPERLAQIATIAIKESLGGQVYYIRKDRSELRANRILRNRDKKPMSMLATSSTLPSGFNGTLRYIYSIILEKAVASVLSNTSPERFAHISTVAIRSAMGGQVYYIPMGLSSDRQERDFKICELWNSGAATVIELARRFQVSQQLVYEVLNRHSEKYRIMHSCTRQLRRERNAKLLASREAGATYRQLGQEFGLCSHHVRDIIQKLSQ